jgi:uncharacterized membrane protein
MHNALRTFSLITALFLTTLPLIAQAPPCRPGNLGAVLGTSCSVGSITLNFAPDFFGFFDDPTTFGLIDPASIVFTPISVGSENGFTLTLNFNETVTGNVGASAHSLQFSYSPQAAPNTEIRSQSVSMDAAIGGSPLTQAFVVVDDQRTYPNSPFPVDAFASLGLNSLPQFNRLFDHHFLEVPAFQGTPISVGNVTTSITSEAVSTSTARLSSATFLYSTGPIVPIPQAAPLTFKVIDLPNVPETFVASITNSGRTVGSIADAQGTFHGYVAEADGVTFTTFDFPGASATFGATLNDHGDVVGTYTDDSGKNHGFLLSGGSFTSIDVPDARFTNAIAINDKGQIVGEYRSQDGGFHGFLLDKGVFTTIDHGPGTGLFASSGVFGINNAGQMVGFFFDPDTFRAFSQKGSDFQAEDVPGQGDATNENVSTSGDTVGIFNDINLVQHGYLLSKGTFLTVDVPGALVSFPLGITASGRIVGQFTGADGLSHSYLATPGTEGGNGPKAAVTPASAATENCNSEAWQLKHAQRHHLTACRVSK